MSASRRCASARRSGVVFVVSVMRSPVWVLGSAAGRIAALGGTEWANFGRGGGLAARHLGQGAFERLDACRKPLDGVGHRVWQMDPIGVGTLDPATVDAHDMTWVADDG